LIPPRSFAAVRDELDRRRRITLGFERIEALLRLLGNPERDLRVVQVVGTNGKGTTAVALAGALEEAGYSSGTYLSPHLLSYTERVMIGGRFVSEELFAAGMGEAIRISDVGGVPASQFELLTAGALKTFADAGLSWAVLEAGLGARHDATTAAAPEAVVLTNVGLDHAEYLGDTVEEIALEKLGGLAPGGTLVLGTDDAGTLEVARRECARIGARLVEAHQRGEPVPGLPAYAAHNARVGIRAAEALLGRTVGDAARSRVVRGVAGLLPARFEEHEVRGVPVIVDGGHNVPGLKAALEATRNAYGGGPLGVVFGALRDKDIGSMLSALRQEADALALTRPASERAAEPAWVVREYGPRDRGGRLARVTNDAGDALDTLVEEMKALGGVVLVTGSLYTGASILRGLREG
jgi:dihydrofolate synthase / folylpolyglutamate synthase